jgi:hypothetical protein
MFNVKLENSQDIINFLKLSVVGARVTITYSYDLRKITGTILKNDEGWITILIPNDTFTITKESIISLELKTSDYNCICNSNNKELELGDIVEITNIDGLNRVLYSDYPKGFSKKLIGLQGKITMIEDVTDNNIIYYLVDFSVGNPRIHDIRYFIHSRAIFLKDNLKLIKKENDKVDDSRFFNPKDIKPLNYKELDGKTLKMAVIDNDECLLVAGVNKENNTIYMLHSEVK